MARRYTRDARGRFASGGFSGQTGGRGARLMSGGRSRAGGGATIKAAPTGGRLPGVVPKTPSGGRAAAAARRKNYLGRTSQRPDPVKVREQASKPRSEPLTTGGGTLAARGSLRRSRAKLRQNDTPSQRGAVTRASRYAGMAIKRERVSLGQSVQGRFLRGKGRSAPAPTTPAPTARVTARPTRPERGTLAARRRLGQARSDAAAGLNPSTARRLTTANREAAGAMRTSRQRLGQSPAGRLVRGKGRGARPEVSPTTVMPRAGEGARPPKISEVLRGNLRALAQSDARFYRELERDFGIKIPSPTASRAKTLPPPPGGQSGARSGKVSTALREGLRSLAQADARRLRDIAAITRDVPAGTLRGSGSRPRLTGSKPRLGPGKRRKV